ncbi:MAG: hypothetical protein M3340_06030 [Actinomycetota bacterium]|nr:hypothetical protein [Actinomycetota bacterium]
MRRGALGGALIAAGATAAAGAALAGAGAGGPPTGSAQAGSSGIEGAIFIGPLCPGPSKCAVNTRPYDARVRVRSAADGRLIAKLRSGRDGRFAILLPPGEYVVSGIQPRPLPRPEPPQRVVVTQGEKSDVIVDYDTGQK